MRIKTTMRLTGTALLALLLAPACTSEEGDDIEGKGCNQNSDCGEGYTCNPGQALSQAQGAQAQTCVDMCLPLCEGLPNCAEICAAQCGGAGGGGGDSGGGAGGGPRRRGGGR